MKKIINACVVICLLVIFKSMDAQTTFSARVGLNIANMQIENLPSGGNQKFLPSFHVGGNVEFSVVKKFAIESGILLSGKGTKLIYISTIAGVTYTSEATISPFYIEIPVNAIYKFSLGRSQLQVFAGPYMGIGVFGKIKQKFSAVGLPSGVTLESMGIKDKSEKIVFGTTDDSYIKRTDFGLNMGIGTEFQHLQIRGQYGLGLANLDPKGSSHYATKNRVISIAVGYLFN